MGHVKDRFAPHVSHSADTNRIPKADIVGADAVSNIGVPSFISSGAPFVMYIPKSCGATSGSDARTGQSQHAPRGYVARCSVGFKKLG